MDREKLIERLKIKTEPNFLAEVGGLIHDFSYWYKGNNKVEIPWEISKPVFENKKFIKIKSIKESLSDMKVDDYLEFTVSIRKKSKKFLEKFFENNEDIVDLFYIYKYDDEGQFPFFLDILGNVDEDSIKDYSKEDFFFDFFLTFLDYFEYDYELAENITEISEKKDIYKEYENLNQLDIILNSNLKDKDTLSIVRALKNWESIYERLLVLIEKLEPIIIEDFHIVKDRYEESISKMIKDYYSFPLEVISKIGLKDIEYRNDEIISIGSRIIRYNSTSVYFPLVKLKKLKINVGLLMEDLIEYNKSDYDEEVFQRKLKSISDPTRFNIITLLMERPYYVKELAEAMHLSAPTLSYHLNMLQIDGFLGLKVKGKRTYYFLRKEAFLEIGENFIELSKGIKEEESD